MPQRAPTCLLPPDAGAEGHAGFACEEMEREGSDQPTATPHVTFERDQHPSSIGSRTDSDAGYIFQRGGGSGQSDRLSDSYRLRRFDSRSLVPARANTEISKRYEIEERPMAAGGYGQVFIARDRRSRGRTVAIKKLMRHDEERVDAMQREVFIMKELDHPSICKLFETYTMDDAMYFVMEHLAGRDLCDRIMEQGRLDEPTAAYIMRQTSGALWYAHCRGIAHRDMKPENVCFCSEDPRDNRVKVIDWGLGKHFQKQRMKSCVGSGAFTAPEVLDPPEDDAGYSAMCDLWSLGVMTYVTLSGKSPFWGTPIQMLKKMRSESYPMSGAAFDALSAESKDFVARLLKANPDQRLSSGELLKHPWLSEAAAKAMYIDPETTCQVLTNVEHFSHAPHFLSICVATVAKQLDHRSLDHLYRVFSRLDTNGDGSLDQDEVRAGFENAFGEAFDASGLDVEEMFARLDYDGTGRITYTEFCAAGIGESSYTREEVLWAAFKAFDTDDTDRVTRENMLQVLLSADVTQVWSKDVCEKVAQQVMDYFGGEDGSIAFEDWLILMRECSNRHLEETPRRDRRHVRDGWPAPSEVSSD